MLVQSLSWPTVVSPIRDVSCTVLTTGYMLILDESRSMGFLIPPTVTFTLYFYCFIVIIGGEHGTFLA